MNLARQGSAQVRQRDSGFMTTYQGKYGTSSLAPSPLLLGLYEVEMLVKDHATALMFRVDDLCYTVIADCYPIVTIEATSSEYSD